MRSLIAALALSSTLPAQEDLQRASIEKQRASIVQMQAPVERQRAAIRAAKAPDAKPDSFYLVPWPAPLAPPQLAACPALPAPFLAQAVSENSQRAGISPVLLNAVIRQESGGRPCVVSSAGAMGLMQLMPDTAQSLGVQNPFDPLENLRGGTDFLRQMLDRYGGDVMLALAAYNAGPARVDPIRAIPPIPETRAYVDSIMRQLR